MIKTIIQHTVPNYQEITDKKVRERYSIVGGILGIICNILLCLGKLGIGTYTCLLYTSPSPRDRG